jgi:arsenite methyltransferase
MMPEMDKNALRSKVREAYSAGAGRPTDKHPFPLGRAFAERLGYSARLLDSLPAVAVDSFAGVSNVHGFAFIPEAATVLDLGCGAGLDSLIAARAVGPSGKVIGIDFSDTMLERARKAATEAQIDNVEFKRADAEELSLNTSSVDIALVNGIFNLNPSRDLIFRELARVLRPHGNAYASELILTGPLPPNVRQTDADWFA